jgi:CRP-like cAMP-binding protein
MTGEHGRSEGAARFRFDDSLGVRVNVDIGDVIAREGEAGDCMYAVLSGAVEVSCNGELLAMLEEGEVFGEMALLEEGPRSATVTAVTATELLRLDRPAFERLVQKDVNFAQFLLVAMSKRLRNTSTAATTMTKAVGLNSAAPAQPLPSETAPPPSGSQGERPGAAADRRPDTGRAEGGRSDAKRAGRRGGKTTEVKWGE